MRLVAPLSNLRCYPVLYRASCSVPIYVYVIRLECLTADERFPSFVRVGAQSGAHPESALTVEAPRPRQPTTITTTITITIAITITLTITIPSCLHTQHRGHQASPPTSLAIFLASARSATCTATTRTGIVQIALEQ